MATMFLAVDIGATKTDLAVYSTELGLKHPLVSATQPTGKFASPEDLLRPFLTVGDFPVDQAVVAVAGPVINGCVAGTISHLPWELDQRLLQENLGLESLKLINDLEAVALALPYLSKGDLHTLNIGKPEKHGALAVIAPGTGLGETFSLWDGQKYRAFISEGGQVNFASSTPLEAELLDYVQKTCDYVNYEMVCSGIGIPNIYNFLKEKGYAQEPAWLFDALAAAQDPTPVIVQTGLDENPPEICALTLKTFFSILGTEAGNLALKVVATGGVYLGGGLPRRILPLLKREKATFMDAFSHKGIMTEIMADIPVYVITHPQAALLGAAYTAFERFEPDELLHDKSADRGL